MPAEKRKTPDGIDPLVEMENELSALNGKLTLDAEAKKIEFEHLKEETLWRLNAMSERTLEMAALEEDEVDMFLAQDEKKWGARLEEAGSLMERHVMNEQFLQGFVSTAFERLLPPGLEEEA